MADTASEGICGCCCLVVFSALNTWCGTSPYGAGGCCNSNSTADCCGSCCKGFDEDAFDAQVKKDLEKTRDPNAPPVNPIQPEPKVGMSLQGATGAPH